jgi:TPP-dependent pyruvate/acetoin dehydrogenase alpha subunit
VKRQPFARDSLKVAEQTILDLKLLDVDALAQWRKDAAEQVDEAIAGAQKEPAPEADKEDWCAYSIRHLVDSFE